MTSSVTLTLTQPPETATLSKCNILLLLLLISNSAWAAQITSNMFFLGGVNPGFFKFSVDGVDERLLCDQFFPNVTSEPYVANVATLADLTGTTLVLAGDPDALRKYQEVAILDLLAYQDPSQAGDVVRANRIIVDGSGPSTPNALALLSFVEGQNPASYDLSGFEIFVSQRIPTQEMTGFPAPEPGGLALLGAAVLVLGNRLRRQRTTK